MYQQILGVALMIHMLAGCGIGLPAMEPHRHTAQRQVDVEVLASHLEIPWALAIAPDGRFFVTERPGRLRVIVDGRLQPDPVIILPVAHRGEGGLLGLALDPAFAETKWVYLYYTYQAEGNLWNRVVRLREEGERWSEPQIVLDRIPGATVHNGGRLLFGPDGKLYITTGDARTPEASQDLTSLAGKILRLNPDGSIPEDNPFADSPVYAYGLRNPQGLAWHPATGQLYATEHGPSGEFGLCCRDEVNLITPGGNYGWPQVTGPEGAPRYIDPIHFSGQETWAPAGATFATRGPWQGNFLFANLRGRHLQRLELGSERLEQVVHVERMLDDNFGRLRDVAEGPDGALYVLTSNQDGRGRPTADDDRILRLTPSAGGQGSVPPG